LKTYSILNDFAFQWIFNQPGREKILRSLLNAVLHFEGKDRIEEIHYLNPFNLARFEDRKKSIVDIKVRDEKGSWYEVEAQVCQHSGFIERTVFYLAGLYSDQARKGQDFAELRPAIGISLLGFNLFRNSERVQEIFALRNADNSIVLADTLMLHYIDLKRYRRKKPFELQTPFEKWLHLLKFSKAYARMGLKNTAVFPDEEELAMALEEHVKLNADAAMRLRMEDRERDRIEEIIRHSAAIKEGRAIGREEGRVEGRTEGRTEGRNEEKLEIAGKLKAEGMPAALIQKITGLSEDEITRLPASTPNT